MLETLIMLCVTELDFLEKRFFAPQNCGFFPNHVFEKNNDQSYILTKIVSANQIPGFLNQSFFQNKLMKQCNSLHVDTNSEKLKIDQTFFGWTWSKMGVANLISGL